MKITLQKLIVNTKKNPVTIKFTQFNYFWGPISTGKSTIPRLILYCLGRDMLETPALQKEFISAQLHLRINEHRILIERKKNENTLTVIDSVDSINSAESYSVPAKASSGPSLIPGTNIINMSDLIFYLSGLTPPKVLRSKIQDNAPLVRLSLADLLWYCYLDQTNMDNSFFYLGNAEDWNKQRKSIDVMNYILGYFNQNVAVLEHTLAEKRNERKSCLDAAQALRDVLKENFIDNTERILHEKNSIRQEFKLIKDRLASITSSVYSTDANIVDSLMTERRHLIQFISELENEQTAIQNNIKNQTQLKNELLMTALKSTKIHMASQIFKTIHFSSCPKCGNKISQQKLNNLCVLCKQDLPRQSSYSSISLELTERSDEITRSINESKNELHSLITLTETNRNELNNIDRKIDDLNKSNDSRFIQIASDLLSKKGLLEGRIKTLEQLLPLPQKADKLETKYHDLASTVSEIEVELTKARRVAAANKQQLRKLKFYFLENLKRANFPQIFSGNYEVHINPDKFYPYLKLENKGELEMLEFFNAGSGGKKTLFKTCFALALHRLSYELGYKLPSLLIIDSPMKNITNSEDEEIFQAFHNLLYRTAQNELNHTQFIIIGSHEFPMDVSKNSNANIQKFTRDINSNYPPLIPYYEGQ